MKRRKSELARTFHSLERVHFVRDLPCAGCGFWRSVNAHTENEGKSRKGHYSTIAPLCADDPLKNRLGCHGKYDRHEAPFDTGEVRNRVKAAAVKTERDWQLHSQGFAA